jgi:C-methyltransferase
MFNSKRYTREVFGSRIVPPPRLTGVLTRLRITLASLHRRTAPAPLHVVESLLLGLGDNRTLGLLVSLDVPDKLTRPMTVRALAEATATNPDALDRVLRYATARGFLARDGQGRYRANAVTQTLRRDQTNSWRPWVEFATSDYFWDSWRHLAAALGPDGTSGTEAATGATFFDYVHTESPESGEIFDAAMTAGGRLNGIAAAKGLDWEGIERVCDVGGGQGAALESLLRLHPGLEGVLFDVPTVVARALPIVTTGSLAARCRIDAGDFFLAVPPDCDRYLLMAVIHDWDDARAGEILGRVREALRPGAQAVVVENVLPDRPRDDFATMSDLLMLVLATGRERTASEYAALFAAADLDLTRTTPLATGATAFLLARH